MLAAPDVSAPAGLAFKAYEIEEFVDIYFYRRLGWGVACLAQAMGLTPNAVSVGAGVVGAAGGAGLGGGRDDSDQQQDRREGQVREPDSLTSDAADAHTQSTLALQAPPSLG